MRDEAQSSMFPRWLHLRTGDRRSSGSYRIAAMADRGRRGELGAHLSVDGVVANRGGEPGDTGCYPLLISMAIHSHRPPVVRPAG